MITTNILFYSSPASFLYVKLYFPWLFIGCSTALCLFIGQLVPFWNNGQVKNLLLREKWVKWVFTISKINKYICVFIIHIHVFIWRCFIHSVLLDCHIYLLPENYIVFFQIPLRPLDIAKLVCRHGTGAIMWL